MKKVVIIAFFEGNEVLVAEKVNRFGDHRDVEWRLYRTKLEFYTPIVNPGGEDEIVPGAIIEISSADLTIVKYMQEISYLIASE